MRFRNDNYIHDGVLYLHYVLDGEGRHVRMSTLWERWKHKHPNSKGPIKQIQSYDGDYVTNNIVDLRVAGNEDLFFVTTESNRKFYIAVDNKMLTTDGYRKATEVGIGTRLVTMDNYKGYYGDHIPLRTDGNSRARAILRNHGIEFEILPNGGTRVGETDIHVLDYNTERVYYMDGSVTFGIDTFRDGIKSLLNLTNDSTDAIVSIVPAPQRKYTIGIYVDGPQNIVLTNGVVLASTQTEVRNDR